MTVVQAPPTLAEIRRRPSWWGIPLLFPFPGAIPNGSTSSRGAGCAWAGRQPVVPEGREAPGARATSTASSWTPPGRSPAWRRRWGRRGQRLPGERLLPGDAGGVPLPFRLEASYRLDGAGLRLRFQAHNPGPGPLPCGFGAHPFFRLPWARPARPGECLISIPAPGAGTGGACARPWRGGPARGARGQRTRCAPRCPPSRPAPRAPSWRGLQRALHRPGPEDGWIAASVIDPPTAARR